MSGPRALLLDAMGTLVRLRPPVPTLRRLLRERLELELPEGAAELALSREIAFYREHLQEGRDGPSVARLRERCALVLRDALREHGPGLEGIAIGEMTALLLDSLQFDPYPDAAPAMIRARESGARVGVVSNWDASLQGVLERTGLGRHADFVLSSAQCASRKPDPAIFRRALALAGVEAREALHVGDSVGEDVLGARAAGIPHALLVRDGATTQEGVVAIGGLDEIPAAWAQMTRV